MQSVKRQSGGNYKLGPGTLYANLDRLLASGLVGETERKLKSGDTRREYCLHQRRADAALRGPAPAANGGHRTDSATRKTG